MGSKYKHINLEEREQIYLWINQGISVREIGRRLGRDHKAISYELKKNRLVGKEYLPCHAQKKAERKASRQRYKAPLKEPGIFLYVREHLRLGWSPETIAGRLEVDYPDKHISIESIYRHIYHPSNKKQQLWKYLTRTRKKRMQKSGRSVRRDGRIPDAVSIDLRSKRIEKRDILGHWETDLMEGTRKTKDVLSVTVERASRYALLTKLPNKKAASKTTALIDDLAHLPKHLRKSITSDNGTENTQHKIITQALKIPVYFCHAYHSWEKGTVENTIGRIRRTIPKGTDLTLVTSDQIAELEARMNNTPRKCLGFLTPYEKISGITPQLLGDYF
jgi:IS30 family transposase